MRVLLVYPILLALPATAAGNTTLFEAIGAGDVAYIRAHLTNPEREIRDRREPQEQDRPGLSGMIVPPVNLIVTA